METITATDRTRILRHMVEAAVLAPSAENTQPWRFAVEADRLIVSLDARRRLASDVGGMLAWTGIGAAVENAVIAARQYGVEPILSYPAPTSGEPLSDLEPAVRIALIDAGTADPLFPFLASRCTSRRLESRPLPPEILDRLSSSLDAFENVRLDWLTEPAAIRPVAKLVGLGNRIRFEHKPFHAEFYENMRFSRAEVTATRDGLDVETLQLPPGVGVLLRLLRSWPRQRIANVLGYSRGVARQAAQEVRSSGAVGVLSVESADPRAFIEGGRALERLWLTATAVGVGFHPTASLPVFLAHAQRTDGSGLLARHRRVVSYMSDRFRQLCPQLVHRRLQMIFRVGYAQTPLARSLRRDSPDILQLHRASDSH